MSKILKRLTLLSLFLAGMGISLAQTTGTLSGRITVRAGEAVPNATVIVTNSGTGASQRVLTAPDGSFTLAGLAPGSYRVEIESAGFKRASQQNVELVAGSPAQVNIMLEAGDAATTVEAQATSRTIQDESGEVAKSLGAKTVSELPVYDRNPQELVGLLPGISPPVAQWNPTRNPQNSRAWNTNGQPHWANFFKMDGLANWEPVTGQAFHVLPQDAVRQMNMATSTYEAMHGRTAGTVMNNQTRPGTNGFHGSLFWLHANDHWSARNYFNPEPAEQAKLRNNQFGASAGGRIVRDRVFFFGAYEGDYLRQGQPRVTTVPTAELRAGDFSGIPGLTVFNPNTGLASGMNRTQFTGNVIPNNQINPVSRAIAAGLPLPNQPGIINNFYANVPLRSDGNRAVGRLDFYVTEQTNVFVRHAYSNFLVAEGSMFNSPFFGGGDNSRLRNHNAGGSIAHRFSPTFTMDGAFGYTRYYNRMWGNGLAAASAFGFREPLNGLTGEGGFPSVNVAGMEGLGNNPNFPSRDVTNSWNAAANGGWGGGRHNLKFGFDIWHIRMNGFQNNMFGQNAGFNFGPGATLAPGMGVSQFGDFPNAWAAFLLGSPTQTGRLFTGVTPHYRTTEYAGYVNDIFKVTDRLTLNFGVRYQVFSPLETRASSFFNFGTNRFTPFSEGDTDLSGPMPWDTNNWAPRFGFAYRVGERTVLRGGYAISYFRPTLNWYASAMVPEGVTGFETGVPTQFGTVAGGFGLLPRVTDLNTENQNRASATMLDDTETPYLQSYSFQIQHDFGSGASIDLGYVGNLGRHLPYTRELNAALPGSGVLPLAQFGRTAATWELGTGLTSNYNAFQASLNKRFTNFLALAGSYTWSKALDYGNGLSPFQNNFDLRSNYGPADWDRQHVFSLSHMWEPFGQNFRTGTILGRILGGWSFNGILRAATGTPLTITADPLLCACPGNVARADVVQTGTTTRIIPQETFFGYLVGVPFRFPVFEFQQPTPGTMGNLGRNSIFGDGFANYDLAVVKAFQLAEQNRLELRGEVFNLTNTPHFGTPVTNINSVNFGQSLSTMPGMGPRTIRFGARYVF